MAAVLSVSVNGTVNNPSSTANTIGLSVAQIRSIEPFLSTTQPINGVTILTVIKMQRDGTKVTSPVYLSVTATASVISSANA